MEIGNAITLIKSVDLNLQKRIIIGDEDRNTSIFILNLYLKLLDYLTLKNNITLSSTDTVKIKLLRSKIEDLKNKCPKICKVKIKQGEFTIGEFNLTDFTQNI